nr:T9SS type A sorting domain-containing protein [Chryseobacterium sp. PS-8]
MYYSGSVLDIKESENSNIQNNLIVFPNPVADYLYLRSDQKNLDIKILDTSGRIVLSLTGIKQKIDVSLLSKGNYIIIIKNSEGVSSTQKFIKN